MRLDQLPWIELVRKWEGCAKCFANCVARNCSLDSIWIPSGVNFHLSICFSSITNFMHWKKISTAKNTQMIDQLGQQNWIKFAVRSFIYFDSMWWHLVHSVRIISKCINSHLFMNCMFLILICCRGRHRNFLFQFHASKYL